MSDLWVKIDWPDDMVVDAETPTLKRASRSEVVAWLREQGAIDYEAASIAWEDQYDDMEEDGINIHAIVDAALRDES